MGDCENMRKILQTPVETVFFLLPYWLGPAVVVVRVCGVRRPSIAVRLPPGVQRNSHRHGKRKC